MDKRKEIEEMAKVIEEAMAKARRTLGGHNNIAMFYAKMLVNAGYRKIHENAVVLTREEYEELKKGIKPYNYTAMFDSQDAYRWEQGYFQGCKETAEKFAKKVNQAINAYKKKVGEDDYVVNARRLIFEVNEICKEFTGGEVNDTD